MKQFRLLSYIWSGTFLAMFLAPVLIAGTWVALLNKDSPDVPDESWLDPILSLITFLSYYPTDWVHPLNQSTNAFPLLQIGIDSLFWGFLIVSLYQLLRWRPFQKKDLSALKTRNAVGLFV